MMQRAMAGWARYGVLAIVVWAMNAAADPGDVFFVDQDNTSGVEDGQTWETAHTTLLAGIEEARGSFGGDVWVAEGVYDETRPDGGALRLRPTVNLFGGFDGTEQLREQRNPLNNVTVIDGSRAANGMPAVSVVIGANETILDGFTIRGGQGQDGGGMTNVGVSPVVRNCVFTENESTRFGGAMLNVDGASPEIVGCVFTGNFAELSGGAVANTEAAPSIIDCLFSFNVSEGAGGAIFNTPDSDIIVRNCTFEFNEAEVGGGAIFNEGAAPLIERSSFFSNTTPGFGGALFNNAAEDPMRPADSLIVNCVIAKNTATEGGGAIATLESTVTVVNCTIADNTTDQTGSAFFNNGATTDVLNSILWFNSAPLFQNLNSDTLVRWSNVGGGDPGPNNIAAEPLFVDRANNDYNLTAGSPNIDAGTANGAPDNDIRGLPRPQGGGVDMGAFEADAGIPGPPMQCPLAPATTAPDAGTVLIFGLFALSLFAFRPRRPARA